MTMIINLDFKAPIDANSVYCHIKLIYAVWILRLIEESIRVMAFLLLVKLTTQFSGDEL